MQKPTLRLLIQTGEVCKCLRAKTLFYEVDEQAVDPHSGYVLYSGMNGPFDKREEQLKNAQETNVRCEAKES